MRKYRYEVDLIKLNDYYEKLEDRLNDNRFVETGWRIVSVIPRDSLLEQGVYQVVFEKHETDG